MRCWVFVSERRAYPRSRGATRPARSRSHADSGLSPLARGNRLMLDSEAINRGPIPARAGQPLKPQPCAQGSGAYPRSRGATCASIAPRHALEGLSPLARGNHSCSALDASAVGPIPARAGQPPHCASHAHGHRAYPRSRGATAWPGSAAGCAGGLSPLARGNRQAHRQALRGQGPIPARAGQPHHSARRCGRIRAYPRSRGATCCRG